jgi:hypothetical protein
MYCHVKFQIKFFDEVINKKDILEKINLFLIIPFRGDNLKTCTKEFTVHISLFPGSNEGTNKTVYIERLRFLKGLSVKHKPFTFFPSHFVYYNPRIRA